MVRSKFMPFIINRTVKLKIAKTKILKTIKQYEVSTVFINLQSNHLCTLKYSTIRSL